METPTVVMPEGVPSDGVLLGLVEGVFVEPVHDCGRDPTPAGWFVVGVARCLAEGEFAELAWHEGHVLVAVLYPPDELPLNGGLLRTNSYASRWVAHPVARGKSLDPCASWRVWSVPSSDRAIACEEVWSQWRAMVRVAANTAEMVVVVDVQAEFSPDLEQCDVILDPEGCGSVDVDRLWELAEGTARRLLAEL